ncbi:response regulator transcription factor [Rhizorhabdus sp. FW153]|uniref:response regulator transcription factor n=1 Tax=Rhizorhabdus sp. FW153 TaxID=3400216 RepID=UPI003CF0B718
MMTMAENNGGAAVDAAVDKATHPAAAASTRSQYHILCVEDEAEILADLVEELANAGFSVEGAGNGIEALARVEARLPDLIVSDMQMPELDGLSLVRELRAQESRTGLIPFIFLSAYGDNSHLIDGRQAGADDYLVKPIDFDLLIAAIDSKLANFQRRAEHVRMETSGITAAEQKNAETKIAGLTQREREVLVKLSQGKANKVIAYELDLSIRTVELYRAALMRALGVRSLAEALKIAVAAGVTKLDAPAIRP